MLKVALNQPYAFPYFPYWQLIHAVDYFGFRDDCQMIKGGFVNRNRIWSNGKVDYLTFPLKKYPHKARICEVEFADVFRIADTIKVLEREYRKAPFFDCTMEALDLENLYSTYAPDLNSFLQALTRNIYYYILQQGSMSETRFLSVAERGVFSPGQTGVIEIVKDIDHRFRSNVFFTHSPGLQYINAIGGKELYNHEAFANEGVDLAFIRGQCPVYEDFRGRTEPGLSILDILFNNDPWIVYNWLYEYELEND